LFLDIERDLWTPSIANTSSGKWKTEARLEGRHSWPFSIELPRTVPIQDPNKQAEFHLPPKFRLPPTFTERTSPVFVDYRLVVTVKLRGLKVNQV
jgi:hypothetical protein